MPTKIRCATRIFIRRLRDLLLTTPSALMRNGTFLLRHSHPSLKTEGNELASTAVIDFEIAASGNFQFSTRRLLSREHLPVEQQGLVRVQHGVIPAVAAG